MYSLNIMLIALYSIAYVCYHVAILLQWITPVVRIDITVHIVLDVFKVSCRIIT